MNFFPVCRRSNMLRKASRVIAVHVGTAQFAKQLQTFFRIVRLESLRNVGRNGIVHLQLTRSQFRSRFSHGTQQIGLANEWRGKRRSRGSFSNFSLRQSANCPNKAPKSHEFHRFYYFGKALRKIHRVRIENSLKRKKRLPISVKFIRNICHIGYSRPNIGNIG
jgi:hypothetical protein